MHITQSKTGTKVFVLLTDWLRDALETEKARQISQTDIFKLDAYILPGPKGGKLSYNTLNDRFVKARNAAGIPDKYKLHGFR